VGVAEDSGFIGLALLVIVWMFIGLNINLFIFAAKEA
jgi:hypothetical protein